jgi:hypothetical protein
VLSCYAHTQRRTALFAAAAIPGRKGFELLAALLAAKANPNLYDPAVRRVTTSGSRSVRGLFHAKGCCTPTFLSQLASPV